MKKRFWKNLGPGLVSGASDDDPSGIATYSQAGAKFGYTFLWTALLTYPFMTVLQKMCARIGLVSGRGLTGTIKRFYPRWVLGLVVLASFPAITLNIGADLAGMGAVAHMLVPQVPSIVFSFLFTVLIVFLLIRLSYRKIARILKWLCVVLFCYLLVPFFTNPAWKQVLLSTFMPRFQWNSEHMLMLVGILGTTISPYLFFWQTSMEVEEVREQQLVVDKKIISDMEWDVDLGILFSNLVFYFIILTSGAVLFQGNLRDIQTVEEAAAALRPLAGDLSYFLFALGIIGTGLLAIPVLAGSLSYMMAETFELQEGLNKKFHEAYGFYLVLIVSMIIAFLINLIGFSPVQSLLYTAVLYGLTAPVLIALILHISNNNRVMGEYTNSRNENLIGVLALVIMSVAAIALVYLLLRPSA